MRACVRTVHSVCIRAHTQTFMHTQEATKMSTTLPHTLSLIHTHADTSNIEATVWPRLAAIAEALWAGVYICV